MALGPVVAMVIFSGISCMIFHSIIRLLLGLGGFKHGQSCPTVFG